MGDGNSAYASAELGSALRGDDPGEHVRSFAGLVDDPEVLKLLNYYDSLFDVPVEETAIGQEILANVATETMDQAVKHGAVSQMKAGTGLTGQQQDGKEFYADVAGRLEHEGSIGIFFGSPGSGKTAATIDVAKNWQIRTSGAIIGNTSWPGFDDQFTSDVEMLEQMATTEGPVLAVIDEIAQDLSGFGSGNKQAEAFSDALLFIRKRERRFGPCAKKGSVLLVGHTRKKTAKSIRRVASFGVEKPKKSKPDFARILESEGGKDTWTDGKAYQGITDTVENYAEYESSEFATELLDDEDGDEGDDEDTERRSAIKTVLRAVIVQGQTKKDAAELVDYGRHWVGDRVEEWEDGEHRGLVEDPEN